MWQAQMLGKSNWTGNRKEKLFKTNSIVKKTIVPFPVSMLQLHDRYHFVPIC